MLARFGTRDVLVTTKDGLLICIAAGASADVLVDFARQVETALGTDSLLAARGRAASTRGPVVPCAPTRKPAERSTSPNRSDLAARVLLATDLLVFQVLLRDRVAITDLVTTVLGPLEQARDGAQPLLDTLAGYFASGGVHAAAARRLHLSVRAVTYRLDRIKRLTGHDVADPTHRFTLEAAVLGARLLDWPRQPLPPVD